MAKVGGQKLPKRGNDAPGAHPVKVPADGKGGAKIKVGGTGKDRAKGKKPC